MVPRPLQLESYYIRWHGRLNLKKITFMQQNKYKLYVYIVNINISIGIPLILHLPILTKVLQFYIHFMLSLIYKRIYPTIRNRFHSTFISMKLKLIWLLKKVTLENSDGNPMDVFNEEDDGLKVEGGAILRVTRKYSVFVLTKPYASGLLK